MPPKFWKHLAISFVVVFAVTLLYHQVIFGAQYAERLKGVSTMVNGTPTPRFPAFIGSIFLTALGYAWFMPLAGLSSRGQYLLHGAVMGLATLGTYTLLAHALINVWDTWLAGSDLAFGLLSGLIMGAVFMFTDKGKARSAARV